MAFTKSAESPCNEAFSSDAAKFVDCCCWLCDEHCDHIILGGKIRTMDIMDTSRSANQLNYNALDLPW